MNHQYDVEVVFRQRVVYRVDAEDHQSAERIAAERWQSGETSVLPGFDWGELELVRATEAVASSGVKEDAELASRFLSEREQLIKRLSDGLLAPSGNDAISAARVAADLGWSACGVTGAAGPDTLRATVALEWLCRNRRAVCFERPRIRAGERGEIRLYCTPDYLDHLSGMLDPEPERHTG